MKKIYILAALLAIAACEQENTPVQDNTSPVSEQRMFMFDPWAGDIMLEVKGGRTFDMDAAEEHFECEMIEKEGRTYLHLQIKEGTERTPFLTAIPYHGIRTRSGADSDTLFIVSRETQEPSIELPSYQSTVGYSINVTGSLLKSPGSEILSARRLFHADQMEIINFPGSFGYGKSEMDYEEMQSTMWEEFGVSGFGTKSGVGKDKLNLIFSGTFNQRTETSSYKSNKYEFHIDNHVKTMVKLFMKTYLSDSDDPSVFVPYLTYEANALLNEPDSKIYGNYTNTQEDIYRLYDDYGTHVLVGGLFGGRYIYMYSRKDNSYVESVAHTASVDIEAKASSSGNKENWLQTYYRVMGKHKGTLHVGGGDGRTEAGSSMDEYGIFIIMGGNGSQDIGSWDESISDLENDNLVLLSYCNRDAIGNPIMNGASDSFVIPMYMLAYDKDRREAMKEYLDDYIDDRHIPLQERPKLVVADFMMKTAENGNVAKAETRVYKDPFGIERPYFPLVGNKYVPGDAPEGAMLDTSSDEYLGVADDKDQLWWVALAYEDECTPVTEITIGDYNRGKWVKRGDQADSGMNFPSLLDNHVCLSFDQSKPAITGVAIVRKGNNGKNYVIASSPGTDMLKPYNDSGQCAQFEKYWGSQPIGNDPVFTKDQNQWFLDFEVDIANEGNEITIGYTTQELEHPLKYQNPRDYDKREEDLDDDYYINN